jgi:phosphate transport system substrate-binding protein
MAIALLYNIPGADEFILDRQSIVDICSGEIMYWNDPRLLVLNPTYGHLFPNTTIKIIYRAGGSGTNQVFQEALLQFNSSFTYSNDPSTWPPILEGRGQEALESGGISVFVDNFPGSLGTSMNIFYELLREITKGNQQDMWHTLMLKDIQLPQ